MYLHICLISFDAECYETNFHDMIRSERLEQRKRIQKILFPGIKCVTECYIKLAWYAIIDHEL